MLSLRRRSNGRCLSHVAECGRLPFSGRLCHRAGHRADLVTGHVRGRALDRDRGARDLGGLYRPQQHLNKSTEWRRVPAASNKSIRRVATPFGRKYDAGIKEKRLIITLKIVPAVIWILVCTEEVTKSESFDL